MRRGVFIFWSLFIATALIHVVFSFNTATPSIGACLKQSVIGEGEIIQEPERKESGQVFVTRISRLFIEGEQESDKTDRSNRADESIKTECATDILVRMKAPLYPRFEYGDHISFQGKLSKPFNFRSDDGREFDYGGYLAKDQVFYEMKSVKAQFIEKGSWNIQGLLYGIKRKFVTNLEKVLGEPHAALAAGLVVGEKSALGTDLIDDFRVAGLIHIVVLSGYNITIVADALRRMLSFLPRVWGIVAGAISIAAFGILVGGGATVVRSCFMSGIALIADLTRRDYSVHRGLFLAGLIMLIQNPLILFNDPSFQLSFMATFGLIMLAKPIEDRLGFITEKFGIRGIVASSVATQIFVSPFLVYMMGSISIVGFLSNILVLPFIPLTMLFVAISGLGGFVSFYISQFAAWVAHALLSYELTIVHFSANLPFAAIHFPLFSGWIVVGVYVGYGVIYFMLYKNRTRLLRRVPDKVL